MSPVPQEQTNKGKSLCMERLRLADALLAAVRELMRLLEQQSSAIIDNDSDLGCFDELIHVAQRAKSEAKCALLAHIYEHQCD
jgi:hypothetical protein